MIINGINWTKNDMARVIVQALFNADKPAKADNHHVKRYARMNSAHLYKGLQLAFKALERRAMDKG